MAKSFTQKICELRRLRILACLNNSTSYRASSLLIQQFLNDCGMGCSLLVVTEELAWLDEQGLVMVEPFEDVVVAILKQAGKDTAEGLATVQGIARPGP